MKQYLELLKNVLENGKRKSNRTGIDTISISGSMLEFDMSTGKFPLLTTKKMGLKTIFSELEMFIKGITSKKFLQDRNSHIWDAWCNPQKVPYSTDPEQQKLMEKEDDLGPIYGFNGNYWDAGQDNYIPVERRLIKPVPEKYENVWDSAIFAATYAVKERAVAESQWFVKLYGEGIFSRLLDIYEKLLRTDTILPISWVLVSNFLKDCTKMPGWVGFLRNPDTYVLDNTYYGSNGYSVDTCVWIPIDEQDHYRMMDRGNFSNTFRQIQPVEEWS